jgi:hypothetical protein
MIVLGRWLLGLMFLPGLCLCLATSGAHAQMTQAPPSPSVASLPTQAIFLFGRANFFNAVAKKRNWEAFDERTLKSINDRFEAVRLKLASRYGNALFPANKPVSAPIRDGACDAATLGSYSTHVEELEHLVGEL